MRVLKWPVLRLQLEPVVGVRQTLPCAASEIGFPSDGCPGVLRVWTFLFSVVRHGWAARSLRRLWLGATR